MQGPIIHNKTTGMPPYPEIPTPQVLILSTLDVSVYNIEKFEFDETFSNIMAWGYHKNHLTNTRLVCSSLNAFFMPNPIIVVWIWIFEIFEKKNGWQFWFYRLQTSHERVKPNTDNLTVCLPATLPMTESLNISTQTACKLDLLFTIYEFSFSNLWDSWSFLCFTCFWFQVFKLWQYNRVKLTWLLW